MTAATRPLRQTPHPAGNGAAPATTSPHQQPVVATASPSNPATDPRPGGDGLADRIAGGARHRVPPPEPTCSRGRVLSVGRPATATTTGRAAAVRVPAPTSQTPTPEPTPQRAARAPERKEA